MIVPSIYYDRHVDPTLAATLLPGGALRWLVCYLNSLEGQSRHAHLHFRRDRSSGRRRGSIKLYWGRTSPLEFQLRTGNRVRLAAAKTYSSQSSALFSRIIPISELAGLEAELRTHLSRAAVPLRDNGRRGAFLNGEATCHAGLMRRYGQEWQEGDPFVMIDAEIRVGYADSSERKAVRERIRQELGLGESVPTKLDALGVLPTGDIALIEVKPNNSEKYIQEAAMQAATHVAIFSRLRLEGTLRDSIQALQDQKRAVGLIPGEAPTVRERPEIVPWIAAADDTGLDWEARGRERLARVDAPSQEPTVRREIGSPESGGASA